MNSLARWIKNIFFFFAVTLVVVLVNTQDGYGAKSLTAVKTESLPIIDGQQQEDMWAKVKPLIVHDKIAKIDIIIKALYNKEHIYMLVRFPDPDESRSHKSWIWNKDQEIYEMGPDREDVFVLKWFTDFEEDGLSLLSGKPHKADIWYWKANRTDPVGYADDKKHVLSSERVKRATTIKTPAGTVLYLTRTGDEGSAAYTSKLVVDYKSDQEPRFDNVTPSGSRADVQAKGVWRDGEWIIEFKRKLNTGHNDDLLFDVQKSYTFGLSRYEIAGFRADPKSDQPLYGSGDVSEAIILSFEH